MKDGVKLKTNEIFDMLAQIEWNDIEINSEEIQLKKVNFALLLLLLLLLLNWWKELETEIDNINSKLFINLNAFKVIV